MDLLHNLSLGLAASVTLPNLFFALVGCLLGTLIGVLPGIGPIATIAMLLPITFKLSALSSLIMLAGIYYGAQYGGSTTAILVNLPGETSSVITCIDGYQMARKGRGGAALAVAALGSFFAGCFSTVFVAGFGPLLGALAGRFNAPEYFALMVLGLVTAVVLAHGSLIKAFGMVMLGLLLATVGSDVNSGIVRYTFDIGELWEGINFLPLVIGFFGVTEILRNLETPEARPQTLAAIGKLWPTREEFKQAWPASVRGTLLGSLLGVLPGGGAVLSSFASYMLEKRIARDPSRFGAGAIEGVAGPESANNAAAQTSFIPLLTLGLPANPVMAIMIGAMIIQGIAPGTAVMDKRPDLFWGLVASMWVANLMLLVINLPLIGIWVKLVQIPYRLLFPSILLLCCIGVYTVDNSFVDIVLIVLFSVLGAIALRFGCEPAPLMLAFVLGGPMEENLRRAMVISEGDPLVFLQRPISLVLLVAAVVLLLGTLAPQLRRVRDQAFQE